MANRKMRALSRSAYITPLTTLNEIKTNRQYRKIQKIIVGKNGTIEGAPLNLGAAGDNNVTAIEFDTAALD